MSPQQQMEQPTKRKKKVEPKAEFDPSKVFDVGETKKEDLELDIESGRYKAQHGQGGDRRGS